VPRVESANSQSEEQKIPGGALKINQDSSIRKQHTVDASPYYSPITT